MDEKKINEIPLSVQDFREKLSWVINNQSWGDSAYEIKQRAADVLNVLDMWSVLVPPPLREDMTIYKTLFRKRIYARLCRLSHKWNKRNKMILEDILYVTRMITKDTKVILSISYRYRYTSAPILEQEKKVPVPLGKRAKEIFGEEQCRKQPVLPNEEDDWFHAIPWAPDSIPASSYRDTPPTQEELSLEREKNRVLIEEKYAFTTTGYPIPKNMIHRK